MRIVSLGASTILLLLLHSLAVCQDSVSISKISSNYFDAISDKVGVISDNIDKKSAKALTQMQKLEAKIYRKLSKIDSLAAENIFSNSLEKYNALQQRLGDKANKLTRYIPKLDSLSTSLKFIGQYPEFLNSIKQGKEKFDKASSTINEFQSKLQNADNIKRILKERKEFLKQQLEKFGFAKELKKINKEVYYYSQQVNEYIEAFKDYKKAERKAFELLSKSKLFKDFMRKNSMLASLFRMPGDPNDPNYVASLAGLQTRAQVNTLIQNQIAAGGPNAQQAFQQNLQLAQSQVRQLKDQLIKWGSGSSEDIMPDGFKPNNRKTKSFLKRLEFGSNVQAQTARFMFPATTDLGLSLGYKLNDKSVVGIGASYKVGLGTGWRSFEITHQGLGLRSFLDWKIKGSFWISGGYEQNYRTEIKNIDQLKNQSAWQKSGLIGVSKVVSVKSKLFKKTKVQLLWDFLSYEQVPQAPPIIFRVGYNFK